MISLSRLACDRAEPGDAVRYADPDDGRCRVVVWNCTRACDLRCRHCYADGGRAAPDELDAAAGRALLEDLAGCGVRVVLFSGGEPLLRADLPELVAHAAAVGLRPVLSSNGVAMTPELARRLREAGLAYAGISIDGGPAAHDALRGAAGAHAGALAGIRACRAAGLKVGLRFTLTRDNRGELPAVVDLLEAEGAPRLCVYHLAWTGRASAAADPGPAATRSVLAWLLARTRVLHDSGRPVEVLTVANHADGPWLILRLQEEGDAKAAARAAHLLRRTGGNAAGRRIACVSWDGKVHPDQFWRDVVLGDVRERPFSEIWTDRGNALLARLRERPRRLRGRCARCRFLDLCNGNLRVRAVAAGDPWGPDPACHLGDAEIEGAPP